VADLFRDFATHDAGADFRSPRSPALALMDESKQMDENSGRGTGNAWHVAQRSDGDRAHRGIFGEMAVLRTIGLDAVMVEVGMNGFIEGLPHRVAGCMRSTPLNKEGTAIRQSRCRKDMHILLRFFNIRHHAPRWGKTFGQVLAISGHRLNPPRWLKGPQP
jgi:hypothetical protein